MRQTRTSKSVQIARKRAFGQMRDI